MLERIRAPLSRKVRSRVALSRIPRLAGGLAALAFAMNSFLPLSDSVAGLAKPSPWYYFNSSDPLTSGADPGHLLVLGAAALVILALGLGVFNRRDLRG